MIKQLLAKTPYLGSESINREIEREAQVREKQLKGNRCVGCGTQLGSTYKWCVYCKEKKCPRYGLVTTVVWREPGATEMSKPDLQEWADSHPLSED